jgi:hypothetical protein
MGVPQVQLIVYSAVGSLENQFLQQNGAIVEKNNIEVL